MVLRETLNKRLFSLLHSMDIQAIQERTANLRVRVEEVIERLGLQAPTNTVKLRRKNSTTAQLLVGGYHIYFIWSDNYWVSVMKRYQNHYYFEKEPEYYEVPWWLTDFYENMHRHNR